MKPKAHKILIAQRYQTMLHRGEVDTTTIYLMARAAAIDNMEPERWREYLPQGVSCEV